jgi:hypothetical protein
VQECTCWCSFRICHCSRMQCRAGPQSVVVDWSFNAACVVGWPQVARIQQLTHHIITQLLYLNFGMALSERAMFVKGHTFSLTTCACHSRTRQLSIVFGIAACMQPHTCTATVGDHGPPCQNDWVAIGRHINMHVLCCSLRRSKQSRMACGGHHMFAVQECGHLLWHVL